MSLWSMIRQALGDPDDRPPPSGRAKASPRLDFPADPAAIYAVGDIHGRFDLMTELEANIFTDAEGIAGEKWLLTIGDHVDRGPASADVLGHIQAPPPPDWRRLALCGNHEQAMLDYLDHPLRASIWLDYGGADTLASYGVPLAEVLNPSASERDLKALLDYWIPEDDRLFLRALPVLIETPSYIFVHAGLAPGVPRQDQSDEELTNFRDHFATSYERLGKTVIHGHEIRREPLLRADRIAIDTGAFSTGTLTAVRLRPGVAPHLLSVSKPSSPGQR